MLNSEAVAEHVSASSGRIAPFGKYLLLQRVSVGGMAEIFKALPANADRIDQIVAIKRILPNIAEDDEFIGMFIDEARIAGQLHHPNICRIYELGRVNNDHYIAMQFLWGRDLLKLMNRHKKAGRFVNPMMAAFIGSKALSALHYAHTKHDQDGQPLNIIHRDVSPQNIIVGYSGQVKLIDFGVARAASQSQKTQAGILKGKFGYMSPEMIRGLPIDHRSDVFAMGICLHELLTNTRLFYGETDFATLELVRDANVMPPSHKAPGVPPTLDAIVLKALSREADERYQDAAEMQVALEYFLATHDPQYGQTDVGMAMRQAFHTEVQRERDRLELFWGMLERGELVRGAEVPASPHDTHDPGHGSRNGGSAAPIEALIGGAEAPAPRSSQPSQPDEELQDEQTHIFFSSNELDEIRELQAQEEQLPEHDDAPPRHPTLSDMIPPPPSSGQSLSGYPLGAHQTGGYPAGVAPGATASGTYQRHDPTQRVVHSAFDQPWSGRQEGEQLAGADGETIPAPRKKSNSLLRFAVMALIVVTLATAAYSVPRFASAGTGALQVEAVGDPDALVRVDGIVRGNPPLIVEGLSPGVHHIEVEASGFDLARADVAVQQGRASSVKLQLERRAETSKALTPTTETPPPPRSTAPEITALPPSEEDKPARPRTHGTRAARPSLDLVTAELATADLNEQAKNAADGKESEPSTDTTGNSETQVAEIIDEELAASNEGELLISTVPWSHVLVDAEDTGRDTPVRALRVSAGAHRIGLRTPDDVLHEVDVVVEAGQVVRIIRRF